MTELPRRWVLARERVIFAALGAGSVGGFDAVRAVTGGRLDVGAGGVLLLITSGVLCTAALGALVGVALAVAPPRPLGRSRWAAFLLGVTVMAAAELAIDIFTDPAPFTEAGPLQGSLLAWLALSGGVSAAALGIYQAARGLRNVVSAVMLLAVLGAAWAWSAGSAIPPTATTAPPGSPNVLLVTLDTVRADRMGAYGNTAIDTRHFDQLAEEGVLFEAASAVAAVTGPSHAAMLSGTGPWDNGVLLNGVPLPGDTPLLAERLHRAGWATAAFVSAYVLDSDLGFSRGFSVYDDDFGLFPGARELFVSRALDMAHRHRDPDWVLERRGGLTTDRALAWLQTQTGPWFAWVHLFDAHGPYAPPPPWDTAYYAGDPRDPSHTSMRDVTHVARYLLPSLVGITDLNYVLSQYDGEVSYADRQLGRLMDAVPANTIVVAIGDHGESLGEHGVWFNHGDDLYETSLRVPFAIRWPGRLAPRLIQSPVEGSDLAPILLGLMGLPTDGMTGRNVLVEPRETAAALCFDRATNLVERQAGRISQPQWRLAGLRTGAARWVQREFDARGEGFDLKNDPRGTTDVAGAWEADAERIAEVDRLRVESQRLLQSDSSRSATPLSNEERARLEALGYLEP
ncbi:MAG: hypothetical protein EXR71_01700 [Myxococcales bacterium]|nr:hypothetical protein [Myxococcales bacterium]